MKANVQLCKISVLKMAKHFCFKHCSSALEIGKKDKKACMHGAEGGRDTRDFFEKPKWLY